MRPDESFVSHPIRNLQTMLRVIAEDDPTHETLTPDGIYGPATMSAVATFQRKHGLNATGVTDQDTWDRIHAEYEPALVRVAESEPIDIILTANQVIRNGQQHPHIYLLQGILSVLADTYHSIGTPSFNGILDGPTSDSLASFQALNRLPMTGHLDKHTWKHLALQYPLAVNRNYRTEI